MAVRYEVDVRTRGSVAARIAGLAKEGQVKECRHMRLEREVGYYKPHCEKDFAARIPADDVRGWPDYWWPKCPADCPWFEALPFGTLFLKSVSRDQYTEGIEAMARKKAAIAIPVPKVAPTEKESTPMIWPDKVTLAWLRDHMPADIWWALVLLLATMIGLGFGAGRMYEQFVSRPPDAPIVTPLQPAPYPLPQVPKMSGAGTPKDAPRPENAVNDGIKRNQENPKSAP